MDLAKIWISKMVYSSCVLLLFNTINDLQIILLEHTNIIR